MRQRFYARQRIRRTADFAAVRRGGTRIDCGPFLFQAFLSQAGAEPSPCRRLGVIASRRVGPAVKRNRAKRIFREIFRLNQNALPPVCDVVILVRSSFDRFTFQDLMARYLKACSRLASMQTSAQPN